MKAILMKVSAEVWARIRAGEQTVIIQKDRPADVQLPIRVFVCLDQPKMPLVGEFQSKHFLRTSKPATLARRSMASAAELMDMAKGGDIYGWTIYQVEDYGKERELRSIGKTKAPKTWAYAEVDEA